MGADDLLSIFRLRLRDHLRSLTNMFRRCDTLFFTYPAQPSVSRLAIKGFAIWSMTMRSDGILSTSSIAAGKCCGRNSRSYGIARRSSSFQATQNVRVEQPPVVGLVVNRMTDTFRPGIRLQAVERSAELWIFEVNPRDDSQNERLLFGQIKKPRGLTWMRCSLHNYAAIEHFARGWVYVLGHKFRRMGDGEGGIHGTGTDPNPRRLMSVNTHSEGWSSIRYHGPVRYYYELMNESITPSAMRLSNTTTLPMLVD